MFRDLENLTIIDFKNEKEIIHHQYIQLD
jgi:hypothetical protein